MEMNKGACDNFLDVLAGAMQSRSFIEYYTDLLPHMQTSEPHSHAKPGQHGTRGYGAPSAA
jgi:hypothetical protein